MAYLELPSRETAVPARLAAYLVDPGAPGPLVAQARQPVDIIGLPGGHYLHPAVGQVPDVASQVQLIRLADGPVAETYALDPATYE